jgi:uncharacterized protein VirK/YbjX
MVLFLRSLRGRLDWRGSAAKLIFSAAKYLWCSACSPGRQSTWLAFLYGSVRMTALLARDPRLLERPHHYYISRRLSRTRRFQIIESHYRYLFTQLPSALIDQINNVGHVSLGQLALKDGSEVGLLLSVPTGRGREGELALYLLHADGQPLLSVIFTLADAGQSLLIGCLQGAAASLGREAVREFTKQAHGLRPKNLLLSMLYAFAATLDVNEVCGISNDAHPFAGKADKIKADYDRFWQECHGELRSDGFYQLPSREPRRDLAQVESKHRSAFRKREQLREAACFLMVDAISRGCSEKWSMAA